TDCRLAAIRPQVFRRLVLDCPEIGIKVISRLADIVLRCDQRIMDLSTLSAVQRVHVELLRRAKPTEDGEGWQIKPMPKHSDIASRASTSRETVVRALNQLSVGSLIERVGKALVIHDYDRLTALAESGAPQMIALR
ncbi:MAG: helix-turn-helix domain-containing protein, partial [Alphaproteobacteria bacterium]|nr:helix-turn-helix domain-containing protein [Alphaproteobacteria bacterium]